jgi:Cd2+/Zn2+-exporting ATPase
MTHEHPEKTITMSGQAAAPEPGEAASCELRVGGMDCPSCAEDIKRSLGKLEGVQDVAVDVLGGKVRVTYAEGKLARGDFTGAVERIGYRVEGEDVRRASFIVEGMDCAEEVRQIEDKLGRFPGVTNLQFDLMGRRLVVEGSVSANEIARALKDIGMTARPEGEEARTLSFWGRRGRLVMLAVSGSLLGVGLLLDWLGVERVPAFVLALSTVAGAWFVAPRAIRSARNLTLDMNFLMLVAAVGAAAIGEWAEGASVVFLFSLAQVLETYSMDRARNAIKALMDLSPTEATVRRNGREETVPAAEVRLDETIIVRPGQKIPLDGEVISGRSAVNQAPITGESIPVDKEPGSEVFAGSINEQGLLEVRVTKLVADTTLARIIHAVEEAQASRAPSQSFVDRFSRYYTPAVVGLAVFVFLIPPLVGLGTWAVWFYRALAMLVIACPCALVISTPVSIVSGLAGAARAGILIKGGLHLENAGSVTTVAFDKTGTLTVGRPVVTDVFPLKEGLDEKALLRLAAAIEQGSEHPLARAILAKASEQGIAPPPVTDFEALIGRGVRASVEGQVLYLGNERLSHERGICTPTSEETLLRFEQDGKTAVSLTSESEPLGVIAIADQVRPEAKESIAALRVLGIRHIVMLTGDNEGTARAVAGQLGIDDFRAGLLPDDKVEAIRELEGTGERVAFVGDGVNDAPALALATVGLAMGAAGTDATLETADIALMADDLSKLPLALRLSRRTLGIIKQNIAFSIAIKVVFLALALGGWATLWMAVASDMGASLAVIANGLRALRPLPVNDHGEH